MKTIEQGKLTNEQYLLMKDMKELFLTKIITNTKRTITFYGNVYEDVQDVYEKKTGYKEELITIAIREVAFEKCVGNIITIKLSHFNDSGIQYFETEKITRTEETNDETNDETNETIVSIQQTINKFIKQLNKHNKQLNKQIKKNEKTKKQKNNIMCWVRQVLVMAQNIIKTKQN